MEVLASSVDFIRSSEQAYQASRVETVLLVLTVSCNGRSVMYPTPNSEYEGLFFNSLLPGPGCQEDFRAAGTRSLQHFAAEGQGRGS